MNATTTLHTFDFNAEWSSSSSCGGWIHPLVLIVGPHRSDRSQEVKQLVRETQWQYHTARLIGGASDDVDYGSLFRFGDTRKALDLDVANEILSQQQERLSCGRASNAVVVIDDIERCCPDMHLLSLFLVQARRLCATVIVVALREEALYPSMLLTCQLLVTKVADYASLLSLPGRRHTYKTYPPPDSPCPPLMASNHPIVIPQPPAAPAPRPTPAPPAPTPAPPKRPALKDVSNTFTWSALPPKGLPQRARALSLLAPQ